MIGHDTPPTTARTEVHAAPRVAPAPEMVWIPGRTFQMGSDHHYPEERPAHSVRVDGFWMDRYPVTNRKFAAFVEATRHITNAEIAPDPREYPDALPEMLYAGSVVFVKPDTDVDRSNHFNWWHYMRGANWRHPQGPGSSLRNRENHPVVHVTFEDAERFAAWAGKTLPTEAEWELAARGGLDGAAFAWGDELTPGHRHLANTWQGEFPWENLATDGFDGTSPVDAFPPNGYGVYDMIGNVWEWTTDWFNSGHLVDKASACCTPTNPRGGNKEASYDPWAPALKIPRKVLKGGSHLCAPSYCRRYRPAARFPEPIDTSTSHVGFRCIIRVPPQ
jgi:formylglycine-generating enzyme required for sulfatase activity